MTDRDRPKQDLQPQGQVPVDDSTRTEPLDLDDGADVVLEQQNVGREGARGGGEWPDPGAPPSDAAPGSAGMAPSRPADDAAGEEDAGEERFVDAYRRVDPTDAATKSTPD
jgi:hypothetical protein